MNKRFAVILLMILAGCTLIAPRDNGNAHRVLLAPVEMGVCRAYMGGGLVVAYPDMPDALDTSRIALIDQNGRWDYFAGMRWADFLPGTIQAALVSSFSSTRIFKSVYSDDTLARGSFVLETVVNKFTAVYDSAGAPTASIEIAFTLRDTNQLRVKKQFTASSNVRAAANNADAIDKAFRQAFDEVQRTAITKIGACRPNRP